MSANRLKLHTIHITLNPDVAAGVVRSAHERGTSKRQIVLDALAAFLTPHPTAATVATTIDAAMERLTDRLQSTLYAALDTHADAERAALRADLQAMTVMLLRHLAPGVDIVAGEPATTHRPPASSAAAATIPVHSPLAQAAQRARGNG